MGENIAVQQVLEHPLYQVANERIGFTHMDIVSPNSPQDNPEYERAVRRLKTVAKGICVKCGEHPIYSRSSVSWCNVCHNKYARENAKKNYSPEKGRANNLRRNYGMTLEEYDKMLFRQGYVCAICGKPETQVHFRTMLIQPLSVDHNHSTGKIRKLLCNSCNQLVRLVEADQERMMQVVKYLKKYDK